MIFGKGYMTNDLFYTCSALVAQAKFSKKNHEEYAGQLEDHYSQQQNLREKKTSMKS